TSLHIRQLVFRSAATWWSRFVVSSAYPSALRISRLCLRARVRCSPVSIRFSVRPLVQSPVFRPYPIRAPAGVPTGCSFHSRERSARIRLVCRQSSGVATVSTAPLRLLLFLGGISQLRTARGWTVCRLPPMADQPPRQNP